MKTIFRIPIKKYYIFDNFKERQAFTNFLIKPFAAHTFARLSTESLSYHNLIIRSLLSGMCTFLNPLQFHNVSRDMVKEQNCKGSKKSNEWIPSMPIGDVIKYPRKRVWPGLLANFIRNQLGCRKRFFVSPFSHEIYISVCFNSIDNAHLRAHFNWITLLKFKYGHNELIEDLRVCLL